MRPGIPIARSNPQLGLFCGGVGTMGAQPRLLIGNPWMDERVEYGHWDVPESPAPARTWDGLGDAIDTRDPFAEEEEGDLGQMGGYMDFSSPVHKPAVAQTDSNEADLGEFVLDAYGVGLSPVYPGAGSEIEPARGVDVGTRGPSIEPDTENAEEEPGYASLARSSMESVRSVDSARSGTSARSLASAHTASSLQRSASRHSNYSVRTSASVRSTGSARAAGSIRSGVSTHSENSVHTAGSARTSGSMRTESSVRAVKSRPSSYARPSSVLSVVSDRDTPPLETVADTLPPESEADAPLPQTEADAPPSYSAPNTPRPGDHVSSAHRRGASQFEYYQSPTGGIAKVKVFDGQSSDEENWQAMPTVGSYEIYDDKNNVVVELDAEETREHNAAASGYTRVAEEDAESVSSLDDKTDFLFDAHAPEDDVDTAFQLQSTKQMLSEQQRIAYAGLVRLSMGEMADLVHVLGKRAVPALDSLRVWGSKTALQLYAHLDLNNEEQLMIESLAEHRVIADDLTPCLKVVQHRLGEVFEAVDVSSANVNELHQECRKMTRGLDVDVKWTVMCDLFLNLLNDGLYDARSRCLLVLVAAKLGIGELDVCKFERKVTDVLQLDESADQDWTEREIIETRRKKSRKRKYAYVGLATVGGGLVIGLSAGLLAPVVGAGFASVLTTIGISGTSGFLAGAGGTAIITTASTAIGAHVGGKAMLRRAGHVKTFEFRPIFNNNRVNVVITVSGWLTGKDDDVRLPFSTIDPVMGDILTVSWEPEMMRSLGQTINILATEALTMGVQQLLAATIMTTLMGALQAPMWLSKLSYLVDNPWSVSLDRAWAAGVILADTLMKHNLGSRPATLVGYSLGARVIYSCLVELAKRKAFGLVQDVFLFGTPVFYNKKQFTLARSVVAGRFLNGYSRKDWILAFLFPAAKRYGSVIGLDPVPSVENLDVSEHVDGHMSYRNKMPMLLATCGWSVTSLEFDEIEDPDPDQLREKQRTLLEELQNDAEKPKKRMFWKLDWTQRAKNKEKPKQNPEELFDLDAIRSEIGQLKPELVFDEAGQPAKSEAMDGNSAADNAATGADSSALGHGRDDDPVPEYTAGTYRANSEGETSEPWRAEQRDAQDLYGEHPLRLPEFDEIEEPASALDYDDANWRIRSIVK